MTKLIKAAIIVSIIVLMLAFIAGGVYLENSSSGMQLQIRSLYAKKDDLINQQQKLEALINDLNNTINYEIARQQELDARLAALAAENATMAAKAAEIQNQQSKIVRQNTAPQAPPQAPASQAPAPAQFTTRAS